MLRNLRICSYKLNSKKRNICPEKKFVCFSVLSNYNSLLDSNLTGYFSNTKMRKHLVKSGVVSVVVVLYFLILNFCHQGFFAKIVRTVVDGLTMKYKKNPGRNNITQ